MAEATTGTVIQGLYTNPVFSQLLRRNFDKNSVWYNLVNTKYENDLKNHGDRVTIYQAGDVALKDYVKGQDMVFDNPDGNKIEVVLNQHKYYAFSLEDIDVKQSEIKDLGEKYVERAQQTFTLARDSFIATKIWDGIAEENMLKDTSITKDTAYKVLSDLRAKLAWAGAIKANGKGYDGKNPWLVVDPSVMGVLVQAPQTIKATEMGDKVTRDGSIIHLAGFDIKESNNGDASSAEHKIIAGTTEAFAYVHQISKTQVARAENRFATKYSALYLFGGDVIQEKALAGAQVTIA